MLSRVADNLYWMSRYLERAENTTRVLEVNMNLMLDRSGTTDEGRWMRMVEALGRPAGVSWTGDALEMARSLTFDAEHRASVTHCISMARENARQVRDEISSEQWQRLNRLYHRVHSADSAQEFDSDISDFFSSTMDGIHLFKGVTDTTMSHGEGWHFIRLGRYLERAYFTATLIEVYHHDLLSAPLQDSDGHQYLELVGLLRCCTAFEAYCQVYTADLVPSQILEFLLFNRDFPHALRYSIDSLRSSITAIERQGNRSSPELNALAGKLYAALSYTTIEEVLSNDPAAYLHSIREQCVRIHDMVYGFYIHYPIQTALAV